MNTILVKVSQIHPPDILSLAHYCVDTAIGICKKSSAVALPFEVTSKRLVFTHFVTKSKEPLTWTPPICQLNFDEKNRLQSYIRPVDGDWSPGLYGIRRRDPIIEGMDALVLDREQLTDIMDTMEDDARDFIDKVLKSAQAGLATLRHDLAEDNLGPWPARPIP